MVKNPFGGGFSRIRRRRFLPTLHISRRLFAGVRAHARVVVVCVENDDDDDAFPMRSNFECVFFLRPSVVAGLWRTLTTTKDDGNETKRIIPFTTTLFYARERRQKEHAEE